MNFLSYIINKFKRKDYNIGIMRFGDNIVIPGREYFKEDKQIELLEEYKKHYLEELNKRNVVTTLNFNSKELKQDMNMNVDIIVRMLMDNEDFYRLAPEELIIQSLKLRMYYEEINRLEEETILRLVALKEIEKSKKVPRRNRMALVEEINQLSVILEMYSYRKSAISIELNNYIDTLSTRELTIDDDVLKQRLDNLLLISDGIYDKEELDKYSETKVKIAILERECERYVYLNKDKVEKLKEELNHLVQLEINYSNKDNLMNICTSLEKELLLFHYYGNHLVDEEELRKLYEFKFKVLTYGIYSLKESPIKKSDNGFSYYKEIIEKKIEGIIQDTKCSKYDFYIINELEHIVEYLKNNENEYDLDEILLNKYKLSFLLAFGYREGMKDFFNKTKISLNKDELDEFEMECAKISGITWSNEFPLASYFEFMTGDSSHPLYYFYRMYAREDNNLIVPIGVKTVDFSELSESLYDKIKNRIAVLDSIECPSSLRKISGYIHFDNAKDFILNEGLEVIGPDVFESNIKCLTIPSSVKDILKDEDEQCNKNMESIEFLDFENSEIVNNKDNLVKFIKSISKTIYTGERSMGYSNIHPFERKAYMYRLELLVSKLIFKSNTLKGTISNDSVTIPSSALICTFERKNYYWPYYWTSEMDWLDYDELYRKLRKIILEESHYDIYHDENEKVKIKI